MKEHKNYCICICFFVLLLLLENVLILTGRSRLRYIFQFFVLFSGISGRRHIASHFQKPLHGLLIPYNFLNLNQPPQPRGLQGECLQRFLHRRFEAIIDSLVAAGGGAETGRQGPRTHNSTPATEAAHHHRARAPSAPPLGGRRG